MSSSPPANYVRRFGNKKSSLICGVLSSSSRYVEIWIARDQAVAINDRIHKQWHGLIGKSNRSHLRVSKVVFVDDTRYIYIKKKIGKELLEFMEFHPRSRVRLWYPVCVPSSRVSAGVLYSEYFINDDECYWRETFSNNIKLYNCSNCPLEYLSVFAPVPLNDDDGSSVASCGAVGS
tara:strand:+ start:734 stop:1264 length:531 start_codon:yes stop_codon:yes gene_type:complete